MQTQTDQPIQRSRILIVDDEPANVTLLQRLLAQGKYEQVRAVTDPRQVAAIYRDWAPDLLLLDLIMPFLDGFAVMEQLAPLRGEDSLVPVLVITADASQATKLRALAGGATDFLTKPIDQTETLLRIRNLLELRSLYVTLDRRVRERTAELEHRVRELTALNKLFRSYLDERLEVADSYRELASGIGRLLEETTRLADAAKRTSLPGLRRVPGVQPVQCPESEKHQ